jgi:hypothetical protein
VEALHAIFCSQLAFRHLRTLGVFFITLMMAAGPAMAGGAASDSFTVGIRILSTPAAASTPEQLNERNKRLYEEQKRTEALTTRADAQGLSATPASARVAR